MCENSPFTISPVNLLVYPPTRMIWSLITTAAWPSLSWLKKRIDMKGKVISLNDLNVAYSDASVLFVSLAVLFCWLYTRKLPKKVLRYLHCAKITVLFALCCKYSEISTVL